MRNCERLRCWLSKCNAFKRNGLCCVYNAHPKVCIHLVWIAAAATASGPENDCYQPLKSRGNSNEKFVRTKSPALMCVNWYLRNLDLSITATFLHYTYIKSDRFCREISFYAFPLNLKNIQRKSSKYSS